MGDFLGHRQLFPLKLKKQKKFWHRQSRWSTGLTVTEALLTVAEEGRIFFVEDVVLVGFLCSSSWLTSIHTWAAETKISGCKKKKGMDRTRTC